MTPAQKEAKAKYLANLKEIYDDKTATINGRDYKFTTTVHAKRVEVFSFYTSIQQSMGLGDMSFLDTDRFRAILKTMGDIVLFDGDKLNNIKNHWDLYPEDYVAFVTSAMGVISYPFLAGNLTS